MSTTQKLFAEKLGGNDASQYIGIRGDIFHSRDGGFLRWSDGQTPGGVLLNMIGRQGYAAEFMSTVTQTNLSQTNVITMNTVDISDGIQLIDSTKIKFLHPGRYNIQFSIQVEKLDAGTDDFSIWLRRNGVDIANSNTKVTLAGNNAKMVAAWNYIVEEVENNYIEFVWYSLDTDVVLHAEPAASNPTRPAIPSVIVTVTQV